MKRSIFISLALLLFFAGCKKQNNQPSFTFSDLPFKQGNSWTYSRYDQSVNIRDTVTITITGVYRQNNTTTYVWVQTALGQKDTAYWVINNDTLLGQSVSSSIPLINEIIFPLSNGEISGFIDSCTTIDQMQINNISYNSLYRVHYTSPIFPDIPLIKNMYFVKGIGIVRYNQNQSPASFGAYGNLATTNYQWDIQSYHLN